MKHGSRAVVALDGSLAYVAQAARNVPRSKCRAWFIHADAQNLPFRSHSFDAVVSGIALNFIPDPGRAVREMRRVVKARGGVALYVWDYAGRMELMRHFWDAAVALDPAATPLDEGVRCNRCYPMPAWPTSRPLPSTLLHLEIFDRRSQVVHDFGDVRQAITELAGN